MTDIARHLASLSPEKRAFLMEKLNLSAKKGHIANEQIIPQSGSIFPLSFAQRRLWFMHQLMPGDVSYNVPATLRLIGHLHTLALEKALNEIIRRHEILRTTFVEVDGEPQQVIAPSLKLTLPIGDLRALPASERTREGQRYAQEILRTPFDLAQGPLIRAAVIRLEELESYFALSIHHIIYDAWSGGKFFRELTIFYETYCRGETPYLPPLPIQYKDFSHWQNEQMRSQVAKSHLAYWKEQLKGQEEPLDLLVKQPQASTALRPAVMHDRVFPRALVADLKELCQRENVTLFMLLLTAFHILLRRYTGQIDITVGVPVANRSRPELEDLIGFFLNILPLRVNVAGDPRFDRLLKQVQQVCLEAYAHQDFPFDRLVEELNPTRIAGQTPLFQYMFSFDTVMQFEMKLHNLVIEPLDLHAGMGKYDLTLFIDESPEELRAKVEYNTVLFDASTIDRLLGHFQTLLENIVADPEQRLSTLSLLSPAERKQILVEWNATRVPYPGEQSIHQIFTEQAERTPRAIAAYCEGIALTYRELNERSNQLARYLQRQGLKPGQRAGICLDRSLDLLIGLLGILKAGGIYVPLDPSYPAQRLAFMLDDAQIVVLVTWQSLIEKIPAHAVRLICLDSDWPAITQEISEAPVRSVADNNCAYMIYTSGSTGQPKGVLGTHRASLNRFNWMWRTYPFAANEVCCQKTTLNFVDAVWEIFGSLLQGIQQVIIPDAVVKDPAQLLQTLARNRVTRIVLVPSLLRVLLENQDNLSEQVPDLKFWFCSGEVLPVELVELFYQQVPEGTLINLYGSSEVAADATCYEVKAGQPLTSVPIGRPIDNTQIYLLDQFMQPVPVGVVGELHIGGDGLAHGYFNQPELTAARFVADPFSSEPGSRLYKTGDRARYLPDGTLEYLGRLDQQVKLRGMRVELGEIETVLRRHMAVRDAIVVKQQGTEGEARLVAYLTTQPGYTPEAGEMRSFLKTQLLDFMLPAAFVFLKELPLAPNGKVDRKQLSLSETVQRIPDHSYVAPRDLLELEMAKLWEELLQIQPIGTYDEFFSLGGGSLTALKLMAAVQARFGVKLPLAGFLRNPTIAQLCLQLRGETALSTRCLVPLHEGNSSLPLFIVHPQGGGVLCYFYLAKALDEHETVYGLQSPGYDSHEPCLSSIEEMADRYIAEIRRTAPRGPYRLAGWSMGGVIAFEIAWRLEAQGEQVDFLGLIDPPPPESEDKTRLIEQPSVYEIQLGMAVHGLGLERSTLAGLNEEEVFALLLRRTKALDMLPSDVELMRHRIEIMLVNQFALAVYRSKTHPRIRANIHLFCASESNDRPLVEPQQWQQYTEGEVFVMQIPGNHYSMVTPPHVVALADSLRAAFRRSAIHSETINVNSISSDTKDGI